MRSSKLKLQSREFHMPFGGHPVLLFSPEISAQTGALTGMRFEGVWRPSLSVLVLSAYTII